MSGFWAHLWRGDPDLRADLQPGRASRIAALPIRALNHLLRKLVR